MEPPQRQELQAPTLAYRTLVILLPSREQQAAPYTRVVPSPLVKLTGNRTSTAGRGPFSAWPDGKRLRPKGYTIRVN